METTVDTSAIAVTRAFVMPPVTKRDGRVVPFEKERIQSAIERAFRADLGLAGSESLSAEDNAGILAVTEEACSRLSVRSEAFGIEDIQDIVEESLMNLGFFAIARRYIVYRAERAKARALRSAGKRGASALQFRLLERRSLLTGFDGTYFFHILSDACRGLPHCSPELIAEDLATQLYSEMREEDVYRAMILAARSRIEEEPEYSLVSSRLLLFSTYREVFGPTTSETSGGIFRERCHKEQFGRFIERGIEVDRLDPKLREFDLARLANALKPERDDLLRYLGVQTLWDRYLLQHNKRRYETPQYLWMRVSMGLSFLEKGDREARAIEFYDAISTLRYVPSTPTLFNAGTLHPQLSSCFLTTIPDDLTAIFKGISDNARLSKWAGGLGNDWTNVRAIGSHIKGTNGESQGVIPFLKVANDTAVAVNQGGKRQGAVCAYLETWHLDFEDFLDLRKNTGDDRRRTHDMNTAAWIPDLFMKRVEADGSWTLFSPNEVPDLHDLYGAEFEARYAEYEALAADGKLRQYRTVRAIQLWRKMLSMLFETGHPWITFKDPSNIRSPQDHQGVVHSSNLCTEILLNTSADETAVCNLGSVNLAAHCNGWVLDSELIQKTVTTAVRMLDNVIDLNFYPTDEARNSNIRHRPVGLGIMGFQDCLYEMKVSYASEEAVNFADRSMELISYHALLASARLAKERGAYGSYEGSKWDRGLLPIDTLALLEKERGIAVEVPASSTLDWAVVREAINEHGMRNSNVMAVAPTATIANIAGVTSSIEPTYRNLYVKSNLSGDFVSVNPYLVEELRQLDLWDADMLEALKYFDGSVIDIDRIPEAIKPRYLTAFELESRALIECASRRQKWIDMGQSLNLYMTSKSGKALHEMYFLAWRTGLKTTYYLRSQAATQIEKSTLDVNKHGIQPRWMKNRSASSDIVVERVAKSCSIDDPTCEACQ